MAEKFYYTAAGLEEAKQELKELKTVGRSALANEIEEAREKGDLKENAEYKAAKESQGLLENKIAKIENMIVNAILIDETNLDTSKVLILSTVHLKNLKTNKIVKFTLVPTSAANLKEGKISVGSPVGKGLIGKVVGEVAEISVPAGLLKFEVVDITREG